MREKFEQLRDLVNEILRLMDEQNAPVEEAPTLGVLDLTSSLLEVGDSNWVQRIDDGRSVGVKFFPNGMVNNPEGPATWTLDGRKLTIKWPQGDAPGGAWVDTCVLSEDGRAYRGKNQDGVGITGTRRVLKKAPGGSPEGTEGEFKLLKEMLEEDRWPEATYTFQVADENLESDKEERAEGIAGILLPSLEGKRFLDFGCGEGHVAKFASREAGLSVGFDIVTSGALEWERKSSNFLLTTDLEAVRDQGPYDVVLMYDVIDHVENMAATLSQAKDLLSEKGEMVIRCHPWTSRHGSHLYKKKNKAFMHLVFTANELELLGLALEPNQGLLYPLESYDSAIASAGLKKAREHQQDTQEVDLFFHDEPLVKSRVMRTFGINEWTDDSPVYQMSLCFVDYVLKK